MTTNLLFSSIAQIVCIQNELKCILRQLFYREDLFSSFVALNSPTHHIRSSTNAFGSSFQNNHVHFGGFFVFVELVKIVS